MRGRIGSEGQAVFLGDLSHSIKDCSGLHPERTRRNIHLSNPVHVFGEIQDDCGIAALPGKARSGSARKDRRTEASAYLYGRNHILFIAGNDKTNWDVTVIRCIGGI
jgi:hypothetical protein